MAANVICISRSLGAGGEEVGRLVAAALSFRYVDDEIIVRAAEQAGVSASMIEQVEHTPGLVARILETIGRAPVPAEGVIAYEHVTALASESYERIIADVIVQTADEGRVVIVAHGASFPLAGKEGVLRVFVTASRDVRTARLSRQGRLDERATEKAIEESDRQRREYLKRFYDVREELPAHYDVTVNTDVITPAHAARVIVAAANG